MLEPYSYRIGKRRYGGGAWDGKNPCPYDLACHSPAHCGERRRDPTPMIDPVRVWVVLTGTPIKEVKSKNAAHITACSGVSTLVEKMVAIAFADHESHLEN